MFKELAPLLRDRAVLITIAPTKEDEICINVVPKTLKEGENKALTTPLSLTGTPEQLDAELSPTLVGFVGSLLDLKNTLEAAQAEIDAAAKAAQAEARAKSKTGSKKEAPNTNGAKQTAAAVPSAEPPKPPVPKTPSLFDMEPPVAAPQTANPPEPQANEEEDILAEVNRDEGSDSDEELQLPTAA